MQQLTGQLKAAAKEQQGTADEAQQLQADKRALLQQMKVPAVSKMA